MATTTIHIPDELLGRIDLAARSRGISRNRFFIQASTEALARQSGEWPLGFFDRSLAVEDQRQLVEGTRELEEVMRASRRNRGAAAL